MDFFKEFSKQFSSVARSVSEKSKEGAEVTRLTAELRSARETLEQLYCRYGRACYALQAGQGNPDAAAELVLRIRATELQVKELEVRREEAREYKRCPGCGAVYPKEAKFCSACGKKLPEEAPKPEPVEIGEYCPACGAKREGNESRCPGCGADFDPQAAPQPAPDPGREPAIDGADVEEPDDPVE